MNLRFSIGIYVNYKSDIDLRLKCYFTFWVLSVADKEEERTDYFANFL
jgi:hypothetical protein